MPPVKTVFVPWFTPPQSFSRSLGPQGAPHMNQNERPAPDRRVSGGKQRDKVRAETARSVLKVKLPKLHKKTAKADKPSAPDSADTAASRDKTHGADKDSDSASGDVFCFPKRPRSKAIHVREKTKLSVLRTMSRMLEENQLLRQRLAALSQAT